MTWFIPDAPLSADNLIKKKKKKKDYYRICAIADLMCLGKKKFLIWNIVRSAGCTRNPRQTTRWHFISLTETLSSVIQAKLTNFRVLFWSIPTTRRKKWGTIWNCKYLCFLREMWKRIAFYEFRCVTVRAGVRSGDADLSLRARRRGGDGSEILQRSGSVPVPTLSTSPRSWSRYYSVAGTRDECISIESQLERINLFPTN